MSDGGLGWHPTGDQMRRSRRLNNAFFAGSAGILWAAGDDPPELGRDDIEPLADILANHMPVSPTVADRTVRLDYLFDTWQTLAAMIVSDRQTRPVDRQVSRATDKFQRGRRRDPPCLL